MTTTAAEPKRTVSADEAREVAEAAREQEWAAPSFVRDLFLGKLRMDLIHPYPEQDPEEIRRAQPFLEQLERLLRPPDLFGILLGVGVDQVHPQLAEEQVADEARRGPLLLARRFGDLARLIGADRAFRLGGRGGHAAVNLHRGSPACPA